jgi:chemotaxis protein methyltransferase CheR
MNFATNIPPAPGAVAPQVNISPELFNKFVDFIYAISGIRFAEAKAYFLASKLTLRQQALKLPSLQAYWDFLQTPAAKASEYHPLLNEVTINETFFYRNQQQLQSFWDEILTPMLAKKRQEGKRTLRFLSAACSTGDEPYTFALELAASGIAKDFTIDICGIDISDRALEAAKNGVYKKYAIRNIPPAHLSRFFTEKLVGGTTDYYLQDDIKKMVRFTNISLMDGAKLRGQGFFDIIFCRNVLIYFDRHSREQVLKNLHSILNDTGYLLVGHSENLYAERQLFRQDKERPNTLGYQKTEVVAKPVIL